jgi:hypothetical protein
MSHVARPVFFMISFMGGILKLAESHYPEAVLKTQIA